MARILISEPNGDVRLLFEHMVRRLGHEPLALWSVHAEAAARIDLLLFEPADPASVNLAEAVRRLRPSLPVVAASIFPASPNTAIEPDAHLLKPFGLGELGAVIARFLPA
jgi:CheY-like chemotaxis protein